MQVVRKTVIRYKCETCGTSYPNKKEALRCEAKPTEKKLFKVGGRIACRVIHVCQHHPMDVNFKPIGKVIRIFKPRPMDGEDNKWVQAPNALEIHAYQYEIKFQCPKCHDERDYVAYASELKACK